MTASPFRLPSPFGLLRRRSALFAALFALSAAFAAPYLVPADPDSAVFRTGTLGALLLLAAFFPVRASHPAFIASSNALARFTLPLQVQGTSLPKAIGS